MDEATTLGAVVLALVTVAGLFVTVGRPVINLNRTLVQIQAKLENVISKQNSINERVTTHGKEIEEVQRAVDRHEIRILNLEEKNKIDKYD